VARGARRSTVRPYVPVRRVTSRRQAHFSGKVVPQVDFARLSPDQCEKMVSVLLARIRQTRHVGGREGGGRGRDGYFSDEGGTDIYERTRMTAVGL
jgi:hypothetical protein